MTFIFFWIVGATFTFGYCFDHNDFEYYQVFNIIFWWPAELGHELRGKK